MQFECCGVDSYTDFKDSLYDKERPLVTVPPACCKQRKEGSGEGGPENYSTCNVEAKTSTTRFDQLHNVGCKDKVINFISEKSTLLLAVGAGVAGFELLVLLTAVIFCCRMDKDD